MVIYNLFPFHLSLHAPAPTKMSGEPYKRLHLHIHSASSLGLAANCNSFNLFCVIELGKQRCRTPSVKGGYNPSWDYKVHVHCIVCKMTYISITVQNNYIADEWCVNLLCISGAFGNYNVDGQALATSTMLSIMGKREQPRQLQSVSHVPTQIYTVAFYDSGS